MVISSWNLILDAFDFLNFFLIVCALLQMYFIYIN